MTEVELVPIRGRTVSLEEPGRVHWGVVYPASDRDGNLYALCVVGTRRFPLYGRRVHSRFEVECKHCLHIAAQLEREAVNSRPGAVE